MENSSTSYIQGIVRISNRSKALAPSESIPGETFLTFDHLELLQDLESAPVIKKKDLVNRLNLISLTSKLLYLHFQHTRYRQHIVFAAVSAGCTGETLSCRLSPKAWDDLNAHIFIGIIIPYGNDVIFSPATIQKRGKKTILLKLPGKSRKANRRKCLRYGCNGIETHLYQNAFHARGELIDFTPDGFRVKLPPDADDAMKWFNNEAPVLTYMHKQNRMFFSSACHCIRQEIEETGRSIILGPQATQMHQFKKKKIRNLRQRPVPSLTVHFRHPLLGKKFQREINDITTSGFSVVEDAGDAVLLPGMTIPELTIRYAGVYDMTGIVAQVIYRKDQEGDAVRCGLAILDMDIKTYSHLTNILANALDTHSRIASEVDLDELWRLFFETGFIYPDKFRDIYTNREEFKKTYHRLYREDPEIARHITYQKDGRIYGHISLLRAYEKTWMIQHLAAKTFQKTPSGLILIKLMNHFTNELCRMPSAKMDYLMCYFRPQNKFSNHLFGKFAKACGQPKVCSADVFSYLRYSNLAPPDTELPCGWSLQTFSSKDLWELNQFYASTSGGLSIAALHLDLRDAATEPLEKVYMRLGFKRKLHVYSLYCHNVLTAVLISDQTDAGLNFSSLLNCVKVFICDPTHLPGPILNAAIQKSIRDYEACEVPVLVYPSGYILENACFKEDKKYIMCVLAAQHVTEFIDFLEKRYKIDCWT